jgi:hypothetical protein
MTTKRSVSKKPKVQASTPLPPSAYHKLDALLHTIRCISQYEDALCELSHEAKRASTLSEQSIAELRAILDKLPAHDYMVELESVRAIVPAESE